MKTVDQIRRERLRELISEYGSQTKFAAEISKSPSQISQWLNQSKNSGTGKPRKMSDEAAREIEAILHKQLGWMDQNTSISYTNVEPGPTFKGRVPVISWVQAGSFDEAMEPYPPHDVEVWMDCPVPHSPQTFALRVRGDSMTAPAGLGRTYPEGCVIFIDPEKRTPTNGDRVIACLTEGPQHEATFKVYKHEDGRKWLQPLNPMHQPIYQPFKVLGTIIGKWEDG